MTIEEARQVLKDNRPSQPYKTEGRRLQAAIDVILEYEEELDRWKNMCGRKTGVKLEGIEIRFYDGIITIFKENETRAKRLILIGEYERKGISLDEIREKYKGKIVIYENMFDGAVYRYGNHGEYWEHIGYTIGFA